MMHVLLWSQRLNCMRVVSMDKMLSSNREAYRDDVETDYVPIAAGSMNEMFGSLIVARNTLKCRDLTKKATA